jgi:hypothetical protein
MPLAFRSLSHGDVAFGFFNIDSDMLLLEHYFLFASEFCRHISEIAGKTGGVGWKMHWQVYHIPIAEDIGDLMGAIHGIRYQGFLGEIYLQFPFPRNPEDFKQRPEGFKNRAKLEDMIKKYANRVTIPFTGEAENKTITIGEYVFTKPTFQALIKYVWRGGYPRWKDEIRPDYVWEMKKEIDENRKGFFEGLILDELVESPE